MTHAATGPVSGVPSRATATGPGVPTPPIEIDGGSAAAASRIGAEQALPAGFVEALAETAVETITDAAIVGEASRDWWPLAMVWATQGRLPARASILTRPSSTAEVSAVVALCNEWNVPLTTIGGRSGVLGASVPVRGGVLLDTTRMAAILSVDAVSGLVEVQTGMFGDVFEAELQSSHDLTVGHWPQSMALSTVGGWVACRGAGQYSTRYGKIEDMIAGLEAVLADGSVVRTVPEPRQAAGPDLTQLLTGSEGTLAVLTSVTLRAHPLPACEARGAWAFPSFAAALEAMRRIRRRGATPAVLRLYDAIESDRSYQTGSDRHMLLVLDEGDQLIVDATMTIVGEECAEAEPMDVSFVEQWMSHRNNVDQLESLISGGYVVDTMEISAPWALLPDLYTKVTAAISAVPDTIVCSAHQSHSYLDGGCLYFTFGGKPEPDDREAFYRACWDAGTNAVLAAGGSLSHHHGVGLNRGRFLASAHGSAGMQAMAAVKHALDPNGILNPGKLGGKAFADSTESADGTWI